MRVEQTQQQKQQKSPKFPTMQSGNLKNTILNLMIRSHLFSEIYHTTREILTMEISRDRMEPKKQC